MGLARGHVHLHEGDDVRALHGAIIMFFCSFCYFCRLNKATIIDLLYFQIQKLLGFSPVRQLGQGSTFIW